MWNVESTNVYSKVCDLVLVIDRLENELPAKEKYALADQMRRAILSVRLNMLEGSGKKTSREFLSYLGNAMGSLKEVRGCVDVGDAKDYFDGKGITAEIRRIERMLFGYMKYVEKKGVK